MTDPKVVPLKTYKPEERFTAMRNEVIFGSGTYSMGIPSKHATSLMKAWCDYLLDHKLGDLFKVSYGSHFRTSLLFRPSGIFKATLERAGYTHEALSLPMPEDGQRQVLRQLADVLADPKLNLKEPQ